MDIDIIFEEYRCFVPWLLLMVPETDGTLHYSPSAEYRTKELANLSEGACSNSA
jgi:hypothetical protein